MSLNNDQIAALAAMKEFLKSEESFFLLTGFAGTGKTYLVKQLAEETKGRLIFTAPTNKATKVLRDNLTTEAHRPECRTIYSLLGLKLEANGGIKELAVPEDPVDISEYKAIILDEGSMLSKKLIPFLQQAAEEQKVKFIVMADEAQIPPVGEIRSEIFEIATRHADLKEMMRYDNELLVLATAVRKAVYHPAPSFRPITANSNGEGVWVAGPTFQRQIMLAAEAGRFSLPNDTKAIAWRNVTVDSLNRMIRAHIFEDVTKAFLPEDRIVLMEPAKGPDDQIIGTTDEEGTVVSAEVGWHPEWPEYKVWHLNVTSDTNAALGLVVLHEDSLHRYDRQVLKMANEARANSRLWRDYWEFREAFHKVKHSYAITAHRSQGSTYHTVFVDWRDILLNRNKTEAYRCLYVACTRASKRLILN